MLYLFPNDQSGVVALDVSSWDHGAFTLDFDSTDYEVQGQLTEDPSEIHAFAVALTEHELDRTRPGWRTEKNIMTGKPYKPGVRDMPGRLLRVQRLELAHKQ